MRFYTEGNMHYVMRTTGPRSNMLGLEFSDEKSADTAPEVSQRHLTGPARVESETVRAEVDQARDVFAHETGRAPVVTRIEFAPQDSPTPGVYSMLALALMRARESSGQ